MKIMIFKKYKIAFRTGQFFLCDNFFENNFIKLQLWGYDPHMERSSIP